jgi:hypothetical protein
LLLLSGPNFTPEHNKFIESVPTYLSELMSVIKQVLLEHTCGHACVVFWCIEVLRRLCVSARWW